MDEFHHLQLSRVSAFRRGVGIVIAVSQQEAFDVTLIASLTRFSLGCVALGLSLRGEYLEAFRSIHLQIFLDPHFIFCLSRRSQFPFQFDPFIALYPKHLL
jgi:hypothetical protein